MTFSRALLAAALVPLLAACDSAGPEMEPQPDPGPDVATVAFNLQSIEALTGCDGATNPGDFQFRIALFDEGNNALQSLDLPGGATYGTHSETTVYQMLAGGRLNINQTLAAQRPRQEGSGVAIVFSGSEWDSATQRDANLDDVSRTALYSYRSGAFQGIVGSQSSTIGSGGCRVRLTYTINVQ